MPTFDEDVIVNGLVRARDGYRPLTNDWEVTRNGEYLEIREPEQNDKVWARFQDDVSLHLIDTPNLWVNGRVGVGTTSPEARIEVKAGFSDWIFLRQERDTEGGGGFHFHNPWGNSNQPQGNESRNRLEIAYRKPDGTNLWGQFVLHGPTGNVGIGTASPQEKLHVNGNVLVSGDIALQNADCAEEFTVVDIEDVDPGTVMVLAEEGALRPSTAAYDKKVVGVVSGSGDFKPALVLDKRRDQANRLPVALVGKVYCKVDADYFSIETGDLLTTSPTLGHAMRATDPLKAFGAVIGKALQPLKSGRSLIPILIALQ